jgi:hypothetical protein
MYCIHPTKEKKKQSCKEQISNPAEEFYPADILSKKYISHTTGLSRTQHNGRKSVVRKIKKKKTARMHDLNLKGSYYFNR